MSTCRGEKQTSSNHNILERDGSCATTVILASRWGEVRAKKTKWQGMFSFRARFQVFAPEAKGGFSRGREEKGEINLKINQGVKTST